MGNVRSNTALTAAVNRGLAAAMLNGLRAGVKSMVKDGVPPKIAARVLFNPRLRRSSDWHH
jgi:hypothetical protein